MLKIYTTKTAIILLIICSPYCSMDIGAERIKGTSVAFDGPEGKPLLLLNDSTLVIAAPRQGDWFPIKLYLQLEEPKAQESIPNTKSLLRDAAVIDFKGNEIGVVLEDFQVQNVGTHRTRNSKKYVVAGDIVVYVPSDHINRNSIIEYRLADMLNSENPPLMLSDFRPHLDEFKYQRWMGQGEFTSYLYYEHTIDDPSPGPRIILIFFQEQLIAIIYSRVLNVEDIFEQKNTPRGYQLIYLREVDEKIQMKLEDYYFHIITNAD